MHRQLSTTEWRECPAEGASSFPPKVKFFRWERLKELWSDLEFPFESPGLPFTPRIAERHKPNFRFRTASNDNLFPIACFLYQSGKRCFGLMYSDCLH